jgi:ActR/RegA family two-component response regulator
LITTLQWEHIHQTLTETDFNIPRRRGASGCIAGR